MWYSSGAPCGLALPSGVVGSGHQVVKRGVMPFDMKKRRPSVVDAIASSTVLKPNGSAISTPATKLGITLRAPKISAESRMRRCHSSRPTYRSLPGQYILNRYSSHTS